VSAQDSNGRAPGRLRSLWRIVRGEDRRARKLRGLFELLGPYRGRVILMFVALLVAVAASLAPPYLAGRAVDDGIRAGNPDALTVIVVVFVAAAILNWGASYAQTYLVNWVGQRALQDLRLRIFRHLQRLSIGFYSRNRAGVLISRMTNDVQALDQLVTDGVATLFASTLTLIGTAAILLFMDVELALITFLVFPLLAVGSVAFRIASAARRSASENVPSSILAWARPATTAARATDTVLGTSATARRRADRAPSASPEARRKSASLA